MAFKELISPTLKELFVKEIESMILSKELKIGEKLPPERELAEKMNVSQAVINGGIIELANKGFLKVIPRKGTYVADYKHEGTFEILQSILEYNGGHFDPCLLNSLLETRQCIECSAAALAAQKASLEDIRKLRAKLDELEHTQGVKQQSKVATDFYRELHIASGNIIYPLIFHAFEYVYLSMLEAMYKRGFLGEEINLLHKLTDLIEQKKPKEAADCVSELVKWVRNTMQKSFTPGQRII